jgi:hypothetical protein
VSDPTQAPSKERSSIEDIRARAAQPVTEIVANPREYYRVQQLLRDRADLLAYYDELRTPTEQCNCPPGTCVKGTNDDVTCRKDPSTAHEPFALPGEDRWLRFATLVEQICMPCVHDEGDDHWRVRSQSGGVYRAKTLQAALRDFWESEVRARDLDGNPTEPEPPASAPPPGVGCPVHGECPVCKAQRAIGDPRVAVTGP